MPDTLRIVPWPDKIIDTYQTVRGPEVGEARQGSMRKIVVAGALAIAVVLGGSVEGAEAKPARRCPTSQVAFGPACVPWQAFPKGTDAYRVSRAAVTGCAPGRGVVLVRDWYGSLLWGWSCR